MNVSSTFAAFQTNGNADKGQVTTARARRSTFEDAVAADPTWSRSSRLARWQGTHKDPIHDVDTIVVFDQEAYPDSGKARRLGGGGAQPHPAIGRLKNGAFSAPFQSARRPSP